MTDLTAIDLFAGAGGFTQGAEAAGVRVAWAANHWRLAVDIHAANHPGADHACQDLRQADWTSVPTHDLLLASPCCQGHSHTRGTDSPQHDASRSTAWAVVDALDACGPAYFIVENVPGFRDWRLFPVWRDAIHRLGYATTELLLDAADHGVPQNRERLFIVGAQGREPELELPAREHVPASSFIDWSFPTWSPINKPGRSAATLRRIAAGREAFGDTFLAPYYGSGSGLTGRTLDRPIGTVTTRDRWALIDGDRMRMLQAHEYRAAMGFPEGYELPRTKREAVHLLGNAVVPPVATDLIAALAEAA